MTNRYYRLDTQSSSAEVPKLFSPLPPNNSVRDWGPPVFTSVNHFKILFVLWKHPMTPLQWLVTPLGSPALSLVTTDLVIHSKLFFCFPLVLNRFESHLLCSKGDFNAMSMQYIKSVFPLFPMSFMEAVSYLHLCKKPGLQRRDFPNPCGRIWLAWP